MNNRTNTPIFVSQKTPEEYAQETKDVTQKELQKLNEALKNQVSKLESKQEWEEEFMTSDSELDDDITITS